MSNRYPSSSSGTSPDGAGARETLQQIARLLGAAPDDADAIRAALEALFKAAGLDDSDPEDAPAARMMSDSEKRAAREARCSPANFMRAKRAFGGSHRG